MSAIDDVIAHLEKASKLAAELDTVVNRRVKRRLLVGIIAGIILAGAVIFFAIHR